MEVGGGGVVAENMEETHMDAGRTTSPLSDWGFLELWGDNTSCCANNLRLCRTPSSCHVSGEPVSAQHLPCSVFGVTVSVSGTTKMAIECRSMVGVPHKLTAEYIISILMLFPMVNVILEDYTIKHLIFILRTFYGRLSSQHGYARV